MKKILVIVFLFAIVGEVKSQDNQDLIKKYEAFSNQARQEYNDFRAQANAEYAKFMAEAWESFYSKPAIPVPPRPEPYVPPVKKPEREDKDNLKPLPYSTVIPLPSPIVSPQPITPVPVIPQEETDTLMFTFDYYHTSCKVHLDESSRFILNSLSEKDVASIWEQLSKKKHNEILNDCLQLREQLNLCDWGYIQLVKKMAESFFTPKNQNEAVLLQMYILVQSGYNVRIAQTNDQLVLLIPSDYIIYGYSYIEIGEVKYYIINKTINSNSFLVFNHAFPREQKMSVRMDKCPNISVTLTGEKEFCAKRYPDVKVQVETNRNLIDFFNEYPLNSNWDLYSKTSLSETLKNELYPQLKKDISGKNEIDAANILLNFVQTAFEYKTDQEQFGYERPFFGDETFYYPYCDCEDRAILYSILVKELMGLEVVLLHYPEHLATAVHFNEAVNGDFLVINGKKFLVCDPTYIGADIGDAMPQFKSVKAEVVLL